MTHYIWDGQQCNSKDASCCPTNSKMPWFLRSLDTDFSDDLELRICDDQGYPDEAIFLDIVELYIKRCVLLYMFLCNR